MNKLSGPIPEGLGSPDLLELQLDSNQLSGQLPEDLFILFESIGIHGSINLMKKWGRSRKAHLLEDKQIPSVGIFDEFLAFEWHLKDLHVTWAHLEKKRTRLLTYTKSLRRKAFRAWRRRMDSLRRRLDHAGTTSEYL
ncbi:hypothetical protein Tco_1476661 [Tanacetum coccineum]